MFTGVVAESILELGFYGRTFMKRISDKKVYKKRSYNQHFTDYAILNAEIMENNCGWRERVHENKINFYGISQQLAGY